MDSPRGKLQKTVLVLLLAMAVVFGVLTAYFQTKPGALYQGALLYSSPDQSVYTGKVHGQEVSIARRKDGDSVEVDLTRGGSLVHHCRVDFPGGTVNVDGGAYPQVEIIRDGETLFKGSYTHRYQSDFLMLFDENGERHSGDITVYAGNALPGASDFNEFTILRFALGPEPVRRGSWAAWALAALLLSGIVALDTAFPMALFRLNYFLSVKDPEPTELYLSMQRIGWVLLTAFILGFYIWSLTIIE